MFDLGEMMVVSLPFSGRFVPLHDAHDSSLRPLVHLFACGGWLNFSMGTYYGEATDQVLGLEFS